MAVFSVTELGEYRRCRRKWNYSSKSRMNLTVKGFGAEALELGSLIHLTLAQWVLEPDAKPENLFANFAATHVTGIIEAYENENAAAIPDETMQSMTNVVKLGTIMTKNYGIKWGSPVPKNMKFAAVEQEIVIPIPGTEHICQQCIETVKKLFEYTNKEAEEYIKVVGGQSDCDKCGGSGKDVHYLSSTFDGLLQDANNWIYVLERKTYSRRPALKKLLREDQFTGYVWVLTQMNVEGTFGKIRGIAYDGMWKREAPPRGSNFDDLFIRETLHKTPNEIETWGKNLAKLVNEMASNPPLYPNIPWQGCDDCSFVDLCDRQLQGDTEEDIKGLIKLNYKQRDVQRIQGVTNAIVG